jgi:chitodextrinase
MVMFGGGHASTNYNAVNTLAMSTLTWAEKYQPTSCTDLTLGNYSFANGSFNSGPSGPYPRAAARHTVDLSMIVGNELILLSTVEGNGVCSWMNPYTSYEFANANAKIAHYNLVTNSWSFSNAAAESDWSAAEYDPVSGKIVILGTDALKIYDPITKTKTTAIDLRSVYVVKNEASSFIGNDMGYNNSLVYYPPNQKMYLIARPGSPGGVYEVNLNRSNFSQTTITKLTTTGTQSPGGRDAIAAYAYDTRNQIIGGGVSGSKFYAFNPTTKAWSNQTIQGGAPGQTAFWAMAYDPVNNVYIFINDWEQANGARVWAYRYANGTGTPPSPSPSDTQAPSIPTNLSASTVSSSQINLSWNASTDNVGVQGYKIFRNNIQIATVSGTSFQNTGLSPSTTYTYTVSAYDAAGNMSGNSTVVSATTQASATADTQDPTAPTNPTATVASSNQINLSWTASTDNVGVTGYRIERCQGSGCSSFSQITTLPGTTLSDAGLSASTSYSYRVRASDAAGNLSGYSTVVSATTQTGSTPVGGGGTSSDFAQRCSGVGVVRCFSFDTDTDFNKGSGGTQGAYGQNFGIMPPYGTSDFTKATRDTTVAADGASSLKFTIPSNSGSDSSGAWFGNFSSDLSVQFGENSEFYWQWRQRFSPEFLNTFFQPGDGWKHGNVTTGDQPTRVYSSCEALGVTMQNILQRGFLQMYHSCTGSTSHGAYDAFQKNIAGDWHLQPGRPSPYCLYSQQFTNPVSYFPPKGNCFGYFANEWMTFQMRVKTGPRVNDEFTNSFIQLWVAREGQPSELVIDWGPYKLSAGAPSENQKYGKIWLTPYNTNKNPSQVHPTAYTWYDSLIISRQRIPDPGVSSPTQAPLAPSNLAVK